MTNRHPTDTEKSKPTSTHTKLVIGKKDFELLRYMSNQKSERLNVKGYANQFNIARSTVYDMIIRLIRQGLIQKEFSGSHMITEKGLEAVSKGNMYVETSRSECRGGGANLSQHSTRFRANIVRAQFQEIDLIKLNALSIRQFRLPNMIQYIIRFSDATIIISLKTITIYIQEIIANDVEESHYQMFTKAMDYIDKLASIGIIVDNITLESAHYARVGSILADCLSKIDNKYYVDLSNGTKVWIDYSTGKIEDETNNPLAREKIDAMVRDVINSNSSFKDIDKIKETLIVLTKFSLIGYAPLSYNGITLDKPTYIG